MTHTGLVVDNARLTKVSRHIVKENAANATTLTRRAAMGNAKVVVTPLFEFGMDSCAADTESGSIDYSGLIQESPF